MKCPNDQTVLAITERQGIEIDYCPTCRGVWLDRGELDKLIAGGESITGQSRPTNNNFNRDDERNQHDSDDFNQHNKKRRKESFLSDMFDF